MFNIENVEEDDDACYLLCIEEKGDISIIYSK